jgi:hypothetical protein
MKIHALVVAAALSLSGSAFAQDVKVDFDKDANFGALKTFTVKLGTSWNNPLSEKRVITEIQQGLTEKGWTPTDEAKADASSSSTGPPRSRRASTPSTAAAATAATDGAALGRRDGRNLHHDRGRVHRRHPGGGHLRRQDQEARLSGNRPGRALGQAGEERKKLAKASDKLFKNFPPGSKDKK